MAKVKCPMCGTMNDKELVVSYKKSNRYYCEKCYTAMLNGKEVIKSDYNKLYDYIIELYGKPPTMQMLKQIKTYIKDDLSYYGIMMSLKYFHEYMENPVDDTKGIGIVPYIYDRAEDYFTKITDIMDYNDTIKIETRVKIVHPSSNSNKLKMRKKINIDKKLDM